MNRPNDPSAALGRTNDAFDEMGCLNVSRAEFDAASDAASARQEELEAMLAASEEHTRHWEAEALRLRRLLLPFAQFAVVRTGSGLDTIAIYVRRGAVRDACKDFHARSRCR